MAEDILERTGQCLCGTVKYKAHLKNNQMDACHCRMCQRNVGGPLMAINANTLDVVAGEAYLGAYQSSDWASRYFCKRCGSSLFWKMKDGSFISINAGSLDDQSDLEFTTEIFIDEKPPHYSFAEDTKKMTGAEVIAAFSAPSE
ncbi:MAG: GFA family protein [Pseudomonadota bacterium]